MSPTVVYCIVCVDCKETRVGEKEIKGDVVPLQEYCPACGATGFRTPALE
jgi:hypothetical protein